MQLSSALGSGKSPAAPKKITELLELPQELGYMEGIQYAIKNIAQMLKAQHCAIYLQNPISGELQCMAVAGDSSVYAKMIPFNQGITGWAISHTKQMVCDVLGQAEMYHQTDGPPNLPGIVIPLIERNKTTGALLIAFSAGRILREIDPLLVRVAEHYAFESLKNIYLLKNEAMARSERDIILDAARSITTLNPVDLFNAIVSEISKIVHCENAIIFSFDTAREELRIVGSKGKRGALLQSCVISLRDETSFTAMVARKHEAMAYDAPQTPTVMGRITESFLGGEHVSLFCAPLIWKEQLRGVVTLSRAVPFLMDEKRIIQDMAPIIATAIENVLLYYDIKTEKEYLQTIFASSAEGICVINEKQNIIRANEQMAALIGATNHSLQNTPIKQALRMGDKANYRSAYGATALNAALDAAVAKRAPSVNIEYEIHSAHHTGASRRVLVTIAPMRYANNQIVIVIKDITSIRNLDMKKADFLQMIAHEVRSPMQTLTLNISYIKMQSKNLPTKQLYTLANQAECNLASMNNRINDLLLLAYDDIGYNDYSYSNSVQIQTIIDEAFNEVRILAEEKNINLHPPMPKTYALVSGDSERLEQMLRNLLTNAIKFTNKEGNIWVDVRTSAKEFVIRVKDTGCGIRKEDIEHIFERFYQADNQSEKKYKGKGLGLAIVKSIVENHHGDIKVESAVGVGTTFTVTIPILTGFPVKI